MKRTVLILMVGILLIGVNAFAGDGDLIVEGNVGIGTNTPTFPLHVVKESGGGIGTLDQFNDVGGGGLFHFRKARGTQAYPTAVLANNNLGRFVFNGYDGSIYWRAGSVSVNVESLYGGSVPVGEFFIHLRADDDIDPYNVVKILGSNGYMGVAQGYFQNNNPTERLHIKGNLFLHDDNDSIILGAGKDARIYYDETDLVVDTDVAGTGSAKINGLEIDRDGFLKPISSTDASAPNNSIYYSSTQSKLVYKDSSGVVNLLY